MNIPSFIYSKFLLPSNDITAEWQMFFAQLITELQTNLSDEGYIIPSLSESDIDLLTDSPEGTLVFDSTNNWLTVNVNGIFQPITTGVPFLTLPVSIPNGGTDADNAPDALLNLGALPIAGGTMTGNLILNGSPSSANMAANKAYVDSTVGSAYTADEVTLHLAANVFSIKSTYVGQTSISTLGVITSGTWNGSTLDIAHGGTNAITAPAALASLGALPLAGGTMTGNLILNGDPTSLNQAANKNYVDNLVAGLSWKANVKTITTANITLSGAQTINGISIVAGDSVLVNNQTTQANNGIYVAASGAWSRRSDADTGAELESAAVLVLSGTLYGGTQWVCTSTSITIGVTNINFVQFGGTGTYLADEVTLHLSGSTFSIKSTYVGQASLTTLGTITTGVWNGTAITDSFIATPYIKADGTRALTGNWSAGAFTATFNSVQIGSAANTITGLATIVNTGTLTLPTSTDTLVGKATSDVLTNKTYDTAATGNSFKINGTAITAVNGSGAVVLTTSPSLITPALGVATATTINKITITQPATGATLTILDGKTLTANNSLTFVGTDATTITFQGTDTYVGRSTTDVLINKSMSGSSNTFTNIPDSAFSTSYIKADGTIALTGNWAAGAFSATFNSVIVGSAANTINGLATIINTGTLTLPTSTDTLTGKATTDVFTNKTYDTAGTGNVFKINGTAISAVNGSGAVALVNTPTLITPILGVATATSINKLTITAPATSATLTIANGKTLTASNTLTFTGTDGSSIAFGTGGTVAYVGGSIGVATATSLEINGTGGNGFVQLDTQSATPSAGAANSAQLFSDGSGRFCFVAATDGFVRRLAGVLTANRIFTLPDQAGTFTVLGNSTTGSGNIVLDTAPTITNANLVTPTLGAISATSATLNGTAGAGFLQLNTQSAAPTISTSNCAQLFTDSSGRFCFQPQTDGFIRRFAGALTANRIITFPDAAGTLTLLGNSSTGSGSVVLDTNAALTTPTATSMNMNGVNGAGFLQLNSQVSGIPSTGASNSVRLFASSGGLLSYICQNDGFIRFFSGTFTANRTITFQNVTGTVYVTGGTNVAIADGGTGASTAAAARTNLGINLDSARNYSDHSALGFGAARTPSTTNDTLVVCSIQITEAAGNSGTVTAQIDGTTNIAQVSLNNNVSGTLGSIITINSMTFICPANSSYQLNSAGGGTRTLSTLYELTL